ncbi:coproporphyrinogen III oxidase family protein [Massilia antarctica]|uniref:Coproporphyrinogen III oxidase family protein n=1 Tax=Massilia antarctica TaxID=2765360 RepID=A0AA48WAD1_9BURK|nr:coproporphyrinogen-III oxidase family protein [Massilia antarctica]QPI48762.1 coproporphyrinogen III oxidase family protein [Massilia antarctica]
MSSSISVSAIRPAAQRAPELTPESIRALITSGAQGRADNKLLIYIHIPFCSSKCHFCDWVVGYSKADLLDTGELRSRYVEALCTQIREYAPTLRAANYRVSNVYWGGGTPTRLTPQQMALIHDTLADCIDLSGVAEYSMECSPETVSAGHLELMVPRGLNRISAGAQSFDPQILRKMGRAHSSDQIERALRTFREGGLTNFNLDLIAGFPGQSAESLFDSIQRTIDAGVPHVSLYMFREFSSDLVVVRQLTSGSVKQVSSDERSALYFAAKAMLEQAGFEEYVVGYFAKGEQFRFNSEDYYFAMRGDYFGFGAGAASTIGRCTFKSGEAFRYGDSNVRTYIDAPAAMGMAPLKFVPDVAYTDGYFKAFATPEGINFSRFREQFGFDFKALRAARPAIREWFAEREKNGAVFIETAEGIALSPETWIPTMIWRR